MMKHVACGMVWLSARGAYTDASPLADVRSCVGAAKQVTMAGRCRPGEHRIKRLRGLCAKSCQKSFRRRAREFDELGPFWQLTSHKNGEILRCARLRNRAEPGQVLPHLR
jgi:hypothetical protein